MAPRRSRHLRVVGPARDPRDLGARCDICPLRGGRPVFGHGSPDAKIAIVGEGPGREEEKAGLPFIGRSGEMLDRYLDQVGAPRSTVFVTNATLCLFSATQVRMASGPAMRIISIVRNKLPGPVLSLDSAGRIVERRIVGWHANPLGGRKLLKLSSEHAKRYQQGRAAGPILTADHLVATTAGWVPAGKVNGMMIATGHRRAVGRALEAINGALLGDGHVVRNHRVFKVAHVISNADYVDLLARLLGDFRPYVSTTPGSSWGHLEQRLLTLAAGPWFGTLRELWYPEGKKVVPRSVELTPMTLAVWFMDDGSTNFKDGAGKARPRSSFATCAFTPDDVLWLCAELNRRGLECRPSFVRWPRIHLSTIGTDRLHALIAPYVPASMQYKLVNFYRGRFAPALFDPEPAVTFYDRAVTKVVHPKSTKTVYCIDVEETHNFLTVNGVVHNCFPPGGDLEAYLQRARKDTKAAGGEYFSPIHCCQPRLFKELRVARCARCAKYRTGPDDLVCTCEEPEWVGGGGPKSVVATGGAALEALVGLKGIMKWRGTMNDMVGRRKKLVEDKRKEGESNG